MQFSEKLKTLMQDLGINQTQLVGMTGIGKSSISQYLSGTHVPTEERQKQIATSLGIAPDYFRKESNRLVIPKELLKKCAIKRMTPEDAAILLRACHTTVREGLKQGRYPWGYAILTSEGTYTYIINAKRFVEHERIEGLEEFI